MSNAGPRRCAGFRRAASGGERVTVASAAAAENANAAGVRVVPVHGDPGGASRLAANLSALERTNAPVAARVRAAGDAAGRFGWALREGARVGLVDGKLGGPVTAVWPPELHRERVARVLAEDAGQPAAVLCLGVGDGQVLAQLAEELPAAVGMRRAVYVVEPDAALLRACLSTHDWSGAGSPLTDPRFAWCVGPAWPSQARRARARTQWVAPRVALAVGREAVDAVGDRWRAIEDARTRDAEAVWRRVAAGYDAKPVEDLAAALDPGGCSRPGRVLLVTSRFTTVLQYSSREIERALTALGYETRTLIEKADHLRVDPEEILGTLRDFEPDAVFTLDHLRAIFGRWLPATVPLISWLQDDLTHLMQAEAGRSVNRRQVVFTHDPARYVEHFGYPKLQTLPQGKMARIAPGGGPSATENSLAFVSNAGYRTDQLVAKARNSASDASSRRLLQVAAERLVATWAGGERYPASVGVRPLVETVATDLGRPLTPGAALAAASTLFIAVVSPLYRQEAVRWVIDAASDRGLRVDLFGAGWSEHPDFAEHARGPVAYGKDLDELTGRSRFNLQAVPYYCMHQRLLDGVAARGFFLIREHATDVWRRDVDAWEAAWPAAVRSEAELLAHGGPAADALGGLRSRAATLMPCVPEDLVADRRGRRERGESERFGLLPHHGEVTFRDAASCRRLLERWSDDAAGRARVVDEQRAHVERLLGYRVGMSDMMRRSSAVLRAAAAV